MTSATGEALRVDQVLVDPLAVPYGMDHWLRAMERGAREARSRLAALAARPDAAAPVRASAEELARFLDDESRSPLLRALRRPLRQFAPGTPGGRSLERCWDGLRGRAEATERLQSALDRLRYEAARVRARFEDDLPRATRVALAEADEAHLARVARAGDVAPLLARVGRAERELERLWAEAGADARPGGWSEEAAPGEVLALLALRLRERARRRQAQGQARTLRLLAGRHVRALGTAGRWHRPARTDAHAVAERMGTLLLTGGTEPRPGEDLALWSELLSAACDTVHPRTASSGWAAHLPETSVPVPGDTGSTRFVIPIDPDYALVTPHHPSAVRVVDRGVAPGANLECQVFLEDGGMEAVELARLDVDPLFEGLQGAGWYATARRARLRVLAPHGDGWIARIDQRGSLRRTAAGAWDPEPRDGGRLRVVASLSAPVSPEEREVGAVPGPVRTFCGLEARSVALPFAECAAGWLRVAGGAGWTADAAQREEEWFRAVGRRVPLTVPRRIGAGRVTGSEVRGPLYLFPFGVRAGELPALDGWLRGEGAHPLLSATARLWLRLIGAGYALGVYHMDSLVFSPGWAGVPHAAVTDAPFAVRLGQYHARPPREERIVPAYTRLGGRVLPPAVAAGDVALPASEAQAFALFALDVLATKPLPLSGIASSAEIAEMTPDLADQFANPPLAVALAKALRPGASADEVLRWIGHVAGT